MGTFWQGEKIGAALLDTAIENVMLQHVINGNIVPLFYLDPTEDSYSWYQGRVDQQSGQRSEGYFSKREVNGSERRPGWWLEAKEGENRLIHAQIHLDNSRKTSEPDLSAGNPASSSAGGSVSNTNTGVETTTTPLATGVDNAGGINFTALPILTQTTSLPRAVSNPQIGGQSGLKLPAGELDEEWHGIEQALNGGIIPSNERLKEYMLEICVNGDCTQEFDKVLSCIADILRLEEESCYPTAPALREMLMLLESDKSAQEMQLALTTVNVEEKAPEVVTE